MQKLFLSINNQTYYQVFEIKVEFQIVLNELVEVPDVKITLIEITVARRQDYRNRDCYCREYRDLHSHNNQIEIKRTFDSIYKIGKFGASS